MSDLSKDFMQLPPRQQEIRAKCFHPTGTFIEFPEEEIENSIPARFERIVQRFSDRVALKSKEKELTYDALNRNANRLARTIIARRGIGQEPVALLVKDPAHLITAHMAVLKAGKFSLTLDLAAPQTRTAHLLEDSQAAAIIVDRETGPFARAKLNCERQLIDIDEVSCGASEENLRLPIAPDDYCYLRYTSGSTGDAKAAVKSHRHVMHAVMNATNAFHICDRDRSVLLTRDSCLGKYTFEVLLNGAALYPFFIPNEGLLDLARWVTDQEMTLYYSFPTALRHFLSALPDEQLFADVRLIRVEAEAIYKSDVDLIRKHFSSGCLLANSFSSTETGVVCLYFLDKDTELSGTTVPAGYPVDGFGVSIVDESGNELGPNQSGEVVVRSRFVEGYWRRPELTERKFLIDRGAGEERLYVTGDVGRVSDDGCLEIFGRKDFQVKIRSFRVDVGEVEAVLALHPNVKEVTVIGKNDGSHDTKLVAYVVPRGQPAPTVSCLRTFLNERLPDYMIPATFATLDKFPLLPTGKVDRRSLPQIGNVRPQLDTPFMPPRTPVEKQLAAIWAEVLFIDRVGILDNFFDLGGHSLAAMRLLSQVIKQFQLEVPLESLFRAPTVAEMGKVLAEYQGQQISGGDLTDLLTEIEAMTDEEAQQLLPAK